MKRIQFFDANTFAEAIQILRRTLPLTFQNRLDVGHGDRLITFHDSFSAELCITELHSRNVFQGTAYDVLGECNCSC